MGDTYRINRMGGTHPNSTTVLTALIGQSKGLQFTAKTFTSVGYDLGVKYGSIGGSQIGPVNTVIIDAAPKWDAEGNMIEVIAIQNWIGPGWAGVPLNITITWQVPGNAAFTDRIWGAHLGGCALQTKKGDVVNIKMGSECTSIHPRGIDPFAYVPY